MIIIKKPFHEKKCVYKHNSIKKSPYVIDKLLPKKLIIYHNWHYDSQL